jgi:type IV pilus assembly protein PilY1
MKRLIPLFLTLLFSSISYSATLNISQVPLFLTEEATPLTMIVMGRDHKLYYEAYNNASDLDGDGALDIRFKPDITYFGYFDSNKCYSYGSNRFQPVTLASGALKTCSGNWSGNFLNYLTTSRIDALRKVLYGGYRYSDGTSTTILERAYIPQDAHSWGAEYRSVAIDGYNISNYTPLSAPTGSNYHLFANVTLKNDSSQLPRLRVAQNVPYRIWEWVSIERPVAGDRALNGGSGPNISSSTSDYIVRVQVCDPTVSLEENCQAYPSGHYKPVGLLQQYGENNSMYFGLLTGSYNNNTEGGVLRKNIGTITNEIDLNTGQLTSTVGIIRTIDRLRFTHFGGNYVHDCSNGSSSWITTRPINNGECRMWGNPIGEMMYETIRYFAGKGSPTSTFNTSGSTDGSLGLPTPGWQNPYQSPTPWCAKPNMLVISDINPSYDSNSIPGSYFSSFSGDLSGFSAQSLGQTIWNGEFGGASTHFIGQSGTNYDGAPTPKSITSFGNIKGLTPEEPTKEGSYYAASAAYYGRINDVSSAQGDQNVFTYAVALISPLPEIKINVNGNTVIIVPYAKSVGGCLGINGTEGLFQPTNQIVDFYIESLTSTSGKFRVNFEDVEQGADHDMDAIAEYEYTVKTDGTVDITVNSTYAAGCVQQHMGYVISGTTADGVYLVVRDNDTSAGSDFDYFLDIPNTTAALPLTATNNFTPGGSTASFLKNPLWYAAKWGSFSDDNENNVPDNADEYDQDGDGTPDNYFLVTNALNIGERISQAFNKILARSGSFSTAALSSGFLNTETKIYQAIFNTDGWQGQLLAFSINVNTGEIETNGSGPSGSSWDAGALLTATDWDNARQILTYKPSSGIGVAFRWPSNPTSPGTNEIDTSQVSDLNYNAQTQAQDSLGEQRLNYIRGETSNEEQNGGTFRNRTSILGDIINSDPLLIGAPNYQYPTSFLNGNETPYIDFKIAQQNRTKVLYVGANDGMLHAFNAETGQEIMAYVPSKVYENLTQLTNPDYSHRYYVNGSPNAVDVFYSGSWHTVLAGGLGAGGQGIFALDITNPGSFDEAYASSTVLWEFTDNDDEDMGYSYARPSIVRMANGQWVAIFGNGFNSTFVDSNPSATGNAILYIVDIQTGALIKKLDTGVGMSADPQMLARPNGLATPTVIDINGDSVADYIYAGDMFGNLWKIDVTSANSAQWDFAFKQGNNPQPLFVAEDSLGNRQPITSAPVVSRVRGAYNTYQVYFGTGKYIELSDETDLNTQSFYAIRDDGANQVTRAQLIEQTILSESGGFRVTSTNQVNLSHGGWYLDLGYNGVQAGERVVATPIFRQNKIIFTTIIPDNDPCGFGGTSWLMELNALDGGRLAYTPFDINNDGKFNSSDYVVYLDGGDSISVPASGIQSTVGLVASPAILNAGDKEYKYLPGTSSSIQTITENPGTNATGRQSWREVN